MLTIFAVLTFLHLCLGSTCPDNSNYVVRSMPNLAKKLKLIQLDCGQVCDTNIQPIRKEKYYDYIKKNVDCLTLFESPILEHAAIEENIDEDHKPPAWCELPLQLRKSFTYNGRIQVSGVYINDFGWHNTLTNWTEIKIDYLRQNIRDGTLIGSYGIKTVEDVQRHIKEYMADIIKGGHILVIGSQTPWIEAMLLEFGAANITTLEHRSFVSSHPQIRIVSPAKLNKMVLNGEIGPEGRQFDGVVTFSSLENAGFGRFGDELNPWADLIAMAKAWCLTKKGGRMLIGVSTGPDEVLFNASRLYGHLQYSHLFANWKVVFTEAQINAEMWKECDYKFCYHPIHILEKP